MKRILLSLSVAFLWSGLFSQEHNVFTCSISDVSSDTTHIIMFLRTSPRWNAWVKVSGLTGTKDAEWSLDAGVYDNANQDTLWQTMDEDIFPMTLSADTTYNYGGYFSNFDYIRHKITKNNCTGGEAVIITSKHRETNR